MHSGYCMSTHHLSLLTYPRSPRHCRERSQHPAGCKQQQTIAGENEVSEFFGQNFFKTSRQGSTRDALGRGLRTILSQSKERCIAR